MRYLSLITLLACTVAFTTGGCLSRAIKEGMGKARGPAGIYMPIQPLSPIKNAPVLASYRNFEMGKITDDIGSRAPGELMYYLPRAFDTQLGKKKLPMERGGKTLIVRGEIIHYESAGTVANVMGPLEEVICRTELVDKDTGKVLGVANCIGRTQETVNQGVEKKAQGLAKAMVSWIDAHYPKAGRENLEEEE
ncbi:MAG: hypothetical protein WC869_02895 [Phycisphaerae bacterium]|jgi:hypothetical protein